MKLAIEIIKREIAQRELAQKHDHLRKDEVQLELESLNKAVKKLTIPDVMVELPTPEIMWNTAKEMNFLCFRKWYAKIKGN